MPPKPAKPSNKNAARVIKKVGKMPTAPVDSPGTTGYDHLIDDAVEAIRTRNNQK